MQKEQVKEHWTDNASMFKTHLLATTKCPTIKGLEIAALRRSMQMARLRQAEVLEVGCGNGYNLFELAEMIPTYNFTGIDYIPEMIESANKLNTLPNVKFEVGDIRSLDDRKYDIIFTDRCLINLDNEQEQIEVFDNLAKKLTPQGSLIILENFKEGLSRLNDVRSMLALPEKKQAEYNLFLDNVWLECAKAEMKLIYEDDFGGLHDLMLYGLFDGDYSNPLMDKITKVSLLMSESRTSLKGYGQNRLYMFQRRG